MSIENFIQKLSKQDARKFKKYMGGERDDTEEQLLCALHSVLKSLGDDFEDADLRVAVEDAICQKAEREYYEKNPSTLECFCKYQDKMCADCEHELEQEKAAN